MKILLSDFGYERYGDRVKDVDPNAEFFVISPDHSITTDSGTLAAEPIDFEIAWALSNDFRDKSEGSIVDRVARSKSLKWFQSPSAGNDQPVVAELLDRGVMVTGSRAQTIAISEFVIRSVLDRLQQAQIWRDDQHDRRWSRHEFREIYGSRWLIYGVGAIGGNVARRARPFEAHITGVRRHPQGDEPVDVMVTPDGVLSVLPEMDVVVIAAPASPNTHHLVNDSFLGAMKKGAILVNVARGSLVDDEAVLAALDSGILDAAILDTFSTEPLPPEHPYWSHPRVDVSPHNSGSGAGRADRHAENFLENLSRYLKGSPLRYQVTGE